MSLSSAQPMACSSISLSVLFALTVCKEGEGLQGEVGRQVGKWGPELVSGTTSHAKPSDRHGNRPRGRSSSRTVVLWAVYSSFNKQS